MSYLLRKGLLVSVLIMAFLAPAACGQSKPANPSVDAGSAGFSGTVIETTNVASYTYVRVDTGKDKIWAAAPQLPVKVGDKVTVPEGMPMKDYYSKTLKRTFELVYFVGEIKTPGSTNPAPKMTQDPHAGLPKKSAAVPAAPLTFFGITTPKGGLTISEIFTKKSALENKKVLVRGKVAKYNSEIMNKNWLHLQDGTGPRGANDLVITTADTAGPGDTVLVEGVLALNKDFGFGYKYDVLLENAKVTVEQKAKR